MATKKISELPLVNRVSGSQVAGGSVLPIVIGGGIQGTTNQISVEDFSLFVNAYNATTSSNTFIGTQNVTGDVNISGRLTVKEVVAQYETASILFSTGSTKLGDQLTDKHEFTGSTNITGSLTADGFITLNGQSLNNAFDRIHQATHSLQLATASIQAYTASADSRFLLLQQTTQSLQQATASLQQATASIQAYTASADSRFLLLQQTTQSLQVATASLQFHSASVNAQLLAIQQTTQSLQVATASLQFHSASVDAQLLAIQQTTQSLQVATASLNAFSASTNAHIVGISAFTSSQLAVNLGNSIYTASVDSHIVGISTYTSSVRDTLARVHQATQSLQVATASLQQFTASQDVRNFVVSQVTGSLIGITNGLMAFTAALDNTYATDAQLYQLYQSTRSLELHSGSMIGVTNGLMAYTASNSTLNTGLRGEVDGIEAYTASLKGQAIVSSSTQVQNYDVFALNSNLYTSTGSLIGITNGLMAFTAALDSTYATDAQLYQLYQATRSIELTTGSLIGITNGLMAYTSSNETWKTGVRGEISAIEAWTASLDSTYATDAQLYQLYAETASIKAEIAGIEALTASFKAAAIVSSSTQVQNYDIFALNSNLYNGTGSIKGEIAGIEAYTASLKGAAIVSSSQQITNYYKFAETASANTFYGNQSITGSVAMTGSLRVGDWIGGSPHVDETARFDVRTTVDRGIKITGNVSADVIITTYRGASDDLVRGMRLQANGIGIYIGDGNANTGSSVASFNTNGLAFESGKGIDFSATSNGSGTTTSELLNDYEEGTWTPVIVGGTTAGTGTYTQQIGKYTKVGRVVHIYFALAWSAHTGTGKTIVTGFPFTNASGGQNPFSVFTYGETMTAGNVPNGGLMSNGTTQWEHWQVPTGGGTTSGIPIYNGTGEIQLSGTYIA